MHEKTGVITDYPIALSSVSFPISVSMKKHPDTDLRLSVRTDQAEYDLNGNGTVRLPQATSNLTLRVVRISPLPEQFILHQNYPNPFNPSTVIKYSLPASSFVTLRIYNLEGKEIATLVKEAQQPGEYQITWNADQVPSGMYFYRVDIGTTRMTKKMLIVR